MGNTPTWHFSGRPGDLSPRGPDFAVHWGRCHPIPGSWELQEGQYPLGMLPLEGLQGGRQRGVCE